MAREMDSWIIGDWLINYSGGFVRRGLAGAVVMLMHRSTGVPLQWVVYGIAASFFLVFLRGVPADEGDSVVVANDGGAVISGDAGVHGSRGHEAGTAQGGRAVSRRWRQWCGC